MLEHVLAHVAVAKVRCICSDTVCIYPRRERLFDALFLEEPVVVAHNALSFGLGRIFLPASLLHDEARGLY